MGSVVISQETSEFKLPTNFKPVSYRLDVTTHLEDKFMFEGIVDIQVSTQRKSNELYKTFNNLNLKKNNI